MRFSIASCTALTSAPAACACFPVEGEDDGVKDRGLARAGVPGDEEKLLVRPGEVHRRLLVVGAKRPHGECQRSHLSAPPERC